MHPTLHKKRWLRLSFFVQKFCKKDKKIIHIAYLLRYDDKTVIASTATQSLACVEFDVYRLNTTALVL